MFRLIFLQEKSRTIIKQRLDALYGDSSSSMASIKTWYMEFQLAHTSICDEPRPGTRKTAAMEDNVKKVHDIILADRKLNLREIFETMGVSKGHLCHILHETLDMRKLSVR